MGPDTLRFVNYPFDYRQISRHIRRVHLHPDFGVQPDKNMPKGFRNAVYAAIRQAGYPPYIALPYAFNQLAMAQPYVRHIPKSMRDLKFRSPSCTVSLYAVNARIKEDTVQVQEAVRVLQENLGLTREDIIAGMLDAVHASQTSIELISAWREVGRLIGAYAPQRLRVEHTHNVDALMQQINVMSETDLLRIAGDSMIRPPDTKLIASQ